MWINENIYYEWKIHKNVKKQKGERDFLNGSGTKNKTFWVGSFVILPQVAVLNVSTNVKPDLHHGKEKNILNNRKKIIKNTFNGLF